MTDKAHELLEWVVKETELMPDNFHISDMLDEEIRAYLAEPEVKTFVRLSEEEVSEILSSAYDMYAAVCATENRLVEKNK